MFDSMREIRQMQELYEQLPKPFRTIDIGLTKQIQEVTALTRQLDLGIFKQTQEIAKLYRAADIGLFGQIAGLTDIIRVSSLVWNTSLKNILQVCSDLNLPSGHPLLTKELLSPYEYWSNFFQSTTNCLRQANSEQTSTALKGSIILAQEHLISSTAFLERVIDRSQDENESSSSIILNALEAQQADLLTSTTISTNIEYNALVAQSPAAQLAKQAANILQLIPLCNNAAKLRGKDDVFKLTNKVLITYARFPWIVAQDEESFGNFVDCLYFIMYEAAGKDKLRFLSEGYLKDEDCPVIWTIKHLRNKYLRHDPDHGKSSDIAKSWRDLADKLALLGLSHLPVSVKDYRHLQRQLLQEVEHFLGKLLKSITEQ